MSEKRRIEYNRSDRLGGTYKATRVEVKCCGRWMRCDHFTNTCECGADYNLSGARLAPRSQWGEETGEQWHDRKD